jgi:signal transduction histidine kinase
MSMDAASPQPAASAGESERGGGLARMAAGVAHELRNPLAVILARVQLLQLGLKNGKPLDPAKLTRTLVTIEEQALRASKVIENLSVFARPRVPDRQPVDLAAAVEHALGHTRTRAAAAAGVTTRLEIAPEAATVLADAGQLRTALVELVANAVEAMPKGGTLTIRARCTDSAWEISVADTGPGVAPHDAPRIFEPFFTTRPGAAGLGLAAVQTIAESHHGSVRLVAGQGGGSEFVLSLPRG